MWSSAGNSCRQGQNGELSHPYVTAHTRACDRRRLRKAQRRQWTRDFKAALADPKFGPVLRRARERLESRLFELIDVERQSPSRTIAEIASAGRSRWEEISTAPAKLWHEFRGAIGWQRREAIERELEDRDAGTVLAGYLFRLSHGDVELADEQLFKDLGLPTEPGQLLLALLEAWLEQPDGFEARIDRAIRASAARKLPSLVFGQGSSSLDSKHRHDLSLERPLGLSDLTLRNVLPNERTAEDEFERADEKMLAAGVLGELEVNLAKLPAAERRALALRAQELDIAFEEAIRRRGLKAVNVRKALSRARKKLYRPPD